MFSVEFSSKNAKKEIYMNIKTLKRLYKNKKKGGEVKILQLIFIKNYR